MAISWKVTGGGETVPAHVVDNPAGYGVRSLPLAGKQIRKILTNRALDPISKIPEYKVWHAVSNGFRHDWRERSVLHRSLAVHWV
jgi:hypothetical protein